MEEKADYITEAMELLKGEPTLEIETPRVVTERRGGELVEAERPAFVKIYTDFKKELKKIPGDDLKVWIYLALSINRFTGDARPGLRKIADDTGLAVNTVRAILERLEDKRLLDVAKEGGKTNAYRPADYASVSKRTVSNRDTVPQTVSKNGGTVSKNGGTVSSPLLQNAQLEELEGTRKGDLVDGILAYQKDNTPLMEFERVFGFGSLPWFSNSVWDKFAKFILSAPGWFSDYVGWRNGEGKYKAFSNRKIRENPQAFMDTGYPEFEAARTLSAPKPDGQKRHKL